VELNPWQLVHLKLPHQTPSPTKVFSQGFDVVLFFGFHHITIRKPGCTDETTGRRIANHLQCCCI